MVLQPVYGCENIYWIDAADSATFYAQAYYLLHPQGSVLIDVPAFRPDVVRALQKMGPPQYIFLTHRDDIGAAAQFQEFFGARVILHRSEMRYFRPAQVDIPFDGDFLLHADVAIVHLPGHTPGSSTLISTQPPGAVFVGDALNIKENGELYVPPHPWDFDPVLKRVTLKKLLAYDFSMILPAHPPEPGMILERDGKEKLQELLQRIL